MKLSMYPVDRHNFRSIAALTVASSQETLIENNALSMLEAWWEPEFDWHCFGLYLDDTPAGFVMAGAWEETKKEVWLDRFMIDVRFQGRGLAGPLLQTAVTGIQQHWPADTIILSIHPDNTRARRFYEKHGFHFTGERDPDFDEDIMTLSLS
ncbi:GNAT family N-acetyltransferase [Alkalicoccus chagannorensis]|uniref:GNAT family N-acetyltransferase n=1 Tax=Alkalicoccus chagannorensis TaxID=427072 RepID=UPI00041B7220|nr:GNAT family N-acetyltransferase [Alkalicoccus chagannorensis]